MLYRIELCERSDNYKTGQDDIIYFPVATMNYHVQELLC